MALKKRGSLKLTDSVLITSVNLASETTGVLAYTNVGGIGSGKLLGRYSGGSGAMEEITISTGLSLDGSGNLTTSGSGSGTVSSGNAKELAYYATSGTTVSGLTTANSSVLVTNGSGTPSLSTDLPTAVTIGAAYIYRVGGTDVAVADGGTGLSSGTSGGILGYTASGTLASSVLLTASALVLGGGADATPTPMASLGTTTTVLHGNAGGAPTFGAIVAADLDATTIANQLGYVAWGSAGAESANVIEITGTVTNIAGTTIAAATSEVQVMVTDGASDGEPSATATIAAAGSPIGTLLAGSGTATVTMRTSSSGTFSVAVTETAVGSRYLWVKQGDNSQCFIRANAAAKQLTFA
jgi:hypothetical protein